jgi:hypothetical protein
MPRRPSVYREEEEYFAHFWVVASEDGRDKILVFMDEDDPADVDRQRRIAERIAELIREEFA